MSIVDGKDRRPVASRWDGPARRRGKAKRDRDVLRSPSYLALRNHGVVSDGGSDRRSRSPSPARRRARPSRYFDGNVDRRLSRSPSPRRRRARSNSYRSEEDGDESDRPSPSRRRRARSNSFRGGDDEPDRRSRSRTPIRRRRGRFNSDLDEYDEQADRRSRSRTPRRRPAPRSCRSRSRSRTRSQECEDRGCCRPRPADDDDYRPPDEDDFYVRIESPDHLFKCVRCRDLLSSPVYECAAGHVTCATCHDSANGGGGGDHKCSHCGSSDYTPSRAVADWLRSVRFSCPNYGHGCPSFLPRHEMEAAHEGTCRYAPIFCPDRSCYFDGCPPDELERHLTTRHAWNVVSFRYGQPFSVRVQPSRSLLRAEDGEIFHLRSELARGGTALSMIRIRPENAAAAEFTYELKTPAAAGLQHRMQMQSTVWATSLGHGAEDANPVSVTVPDDMFPLEGPEQDSVEVRVHKVAPAPAPARDN
ncbi:hypothetical protein PAHAL_5G456800 [Panicum hallii]|uniref:SIAH-type domain-containing protein n=1 Tax=Panicum hallii TaxID=206008 RepID=A0A2S3HXD4_9POAL|nr:hypothetical protein PAHAL_5G456800 [Panicum hallii]